MRKASTWAALALVGVLLLPESSSAATGAVLLESRALSRSSRQPRSTASRCFSWSVFNTALSKPFRPSHASHSERRMCVTRIKCRHPNLSRLLRCLMANDR